MYYIRNLTDNFEYIVHKIYNLFMDARIVVHGGIGSQEDKQRFINEEIIPKCDNILKNGGSSIDAVEKAVNMLEEDERFNAGRGSFLQLDGEARPDAGIMTDDSDYGAVANIERIINPVSVAREVMEDSPNPFIAGKFATEFALQKGYNLRNLKTDKRLKVWKNQVEKLENLSFEEKLGKLNNNGTGTVGAVAVDKEGNLCAATSTGGVSDMIEGRVGDSPIIGCGYYCDEDVAVSVTGDGDSIMKKQLSRSVSQLYDGSIKKAVNKAVKEFEEDTGGVAGVIAVDSNGNSHAQTTNSIKYGTN